MNCSLHVPKKDQKYKFVFPFQITPGHEASKNISDLIPWSDIYENHLNRLLSER